MKKIFPIFLSAVTLLTFACSENKPESDTSGEIQTQEIQATLDTPTNQILTEEPVNTSSDVNTIPATANTIPAQSSSAGTQSGLNPAHGEPGHDCAIAVGAPLNSAKSSSGPAVQSAVQNPPQIQGSQNISPAPTSAPIMAAPTNQIPAGTSGKLNPAHGEPGHDCAKPVGSPL